MLSNLIEKIETRCLINGKWITTDRMFAVQNPANGDEVASVHAAGQEEAEAAIKAAHKAFISWSQCTAKERAAILKRWHTLTLEHVDALAHLLHLEQGKPYAEAEEEIYDGALFLEWYAEEVTRTHGYTALSSDPNRRMMTLKQPVGVVGVITPWNFPSAIPLQKCAPALAAGCTVILKPAEDTPLSALAHATLAEQAGLPPGVLNVLPCLDPNPIGKKLLESPLVRLLTFTGSTPIGKKLMQGASQTAKKVYLELGGNCPVIIFDDADLELAAQKTAEFKCYNAGQCCNTLNRFLIQDAVYDKFIKLLLDKMQTATVGPLINQKALEKVNRLVQNAQKYGAKVLTGGTADGLIYQPTVLSGIQPFMDIYKEEIFGPVAACMPFLSEEEAIQMGNDTPYGLAAYVFSQNQGRTWRIAEQLEAGSIGINTTDVFSELLPFGGWKESGLGREMGLKNSLDAFYETKSLVIGGLDLL